MKIAVLGGGNGSYASAVDLTEQGHEVRLWRRDQAAVERLREHRNTLVLKDFQGERDITLAMVTPDLTEAVQDAALVVCPVPAMAQADIAEQLAGCLCDGQVVFLPPGSFGSCMMAKRIHDAGNRADIVFAEAGTLPYLTRKHGEFTVAVTTRATRLPTGVFPLRRRDQAWPILQRAYPAVEDAGDALSGALMNAGPIIHPPLIIMNAGPIEHFEHWDIHNEGTQAAIRRVTTQLDAERIAVRERLGYGAPHFPLADHYDNQREEWMYGNLAHDKLVDSGDWRERLLLTQHRYMREDVQTGLALLVSIARWSGVPAPVANALLSLGSAICEEDFRQTGRTLENLGLAGMSVPQMHDLMQAGF